MRPRRNILRLYPPLLPVRLVRRAPQDAAGTRRRETMLEPEARGGKNWVLGVTALASFMMALDGQVITTSFATIRGEFGASVETLQWTSMATILPSRCC